MNLVEKAYALAVPTVTVNPTGGTIDSLFTQVVSWVGLIAGILAFFYLVYSGILYLTAGGNADQAKKAQQGIINAVIGLIIIILAYAILTAVIAKIPVNSLPTT